MKAKRLRALLVAGLLSLAPAVTLTSCSGGSGGGRGGNSQNTGSPNEDGDDGDGDSSQAEEAKDYAPNTLTPCKIEFNNTNRAVWLASNGARIWDSIQSCYDDGYWSYTKTGVNKGYLTVTNCTNTISTYPSHIWLKVSLRGEITFSEDNKAYWDYTQVLTNSNGKVTTTSSGGSCTITNL